MTPHPFFHSPEWFSVLDYGFGARSLVMPSTPPIAFTIFKGGPFRLAYTNFPVGAVTAEEMSLTKSDDTIQFLRMHGVHIFNFVTSHLTDRISQSEVIYLPETIIENLMEWEESRLPSDVRYEVRRSRREGLRVREAGVEDAENLYLLYKDTISRHGGNIRYTLKYFQALVALAEHDHHLDCRVGLPPDQDTPCAFIIVVYDGDTAYYLHGGYDAHYARLRSGYGLISLAIAKARDSGCRAFNLMASPADQPALVKFKEKWGGITRQVITHRSPLNFTGKLLLTVLHLKNRLIKLI